MTTSKSSDSSKKSDASENAQKASENAVAPQGPSPLLDGPTTADLNPAYSGDPEQQEKDAKDNDKS